MKKFLSILCALCMTMALAVPSFAVDVTTDSVATMDYITTWEIF